MNEDAEFDAAARRADEVRKAEDRRTRVDRIGDVSMDDVMASIAKAHDAWEQNQTKQRSSTPNEYREALAVGLRNRLPHYLRVEPSVLLSRINDPRLVDAAKWWHWERGNLVLVGKTGLGKSHAAAVIVERMITSAKRLGGWEWGWCYGSEGGTVGGIRWFAASELQLARDQHPRGVGGDAPDVKTACSARLLVIDNAGWDHNPIPVRDVLNSRLERGRQTIVCSGMKMDELAAHYGDEVVRRMVEVGGKQARIVDCWSPRSETGIDAKTAAAGGD